MVRLSDLRDLFELKSLYDSMSSDITGKTADHKKQQNNESHLVKKKYRHNFKNMSDSNRRYLS